MKRFAPATARNREPLLAELRRLLPTTGTVLEIASGTGEHAVYFASALPGITWQPSDPDEPSRKSIAAWRTDSRLPNLRPPLALDVTEPWPIAPHDLPLAAIVAINMVHISPWQATVSLLAGAAKFLAPDGVLVLYGPYILPDQPTAPSNLAFDADLRGRNESWGVRALVDVLREAATHGLVADPPVAMPANNFVIALRRADSPA